MKRSAPDMAMRYHGNGIALGAYKALYRYTKDRRARWLLPQPRSDAEFAAVTEFIFGMPLALKDLSIYGSDGRYEIAQPYSTYDDSSFNMAAHNSSYDVSAQMMKACFGPLRCGGIAAHAYGQFSIEGHRNRLRLTRWATQRNTGRGAGLSGLRPAFARLAEQCRARREQR